MYKVAFEYKSGKKGLCNEYGKDVVFNTREEAEAYANNLNECIEDDFKDFFPTWKALKVDEETDGI